MSDAVEQLIAGFADEVARLPAEVIVMLAPDEARSLGRRCARSGLASLIWASRLGDTLNTTEVSKRLKISRQALAKRMAAGTVLGIPGRTTTYYPIWQSSLMTAMSEKKSARYSGYSNRRWDLSMLTQFPLG